jgi:hypothetical protein
MRGVVRDGGKAAVALRSVVNVKGRSLRLRRQDKDRPARRSSRPARPPLFGDVALQHRWEPLARQHGEMFRQCGRNFFGLHFRHTRQLSAVN